MKRFLAIILVLILFIPETVAFAANIDWKSMSDQEIVDSINAGRIELASRQTDAPDHITIINQDNIEVYLTGNYSYDSYGDTIDLYLEAVVVNGTNFTLNISDNGCCVNGWNVDTSGIYETPANRKQKDSFTLRISDADISTFEEITDIDFVLTAYEKDNYSNRFDLSPFTFTK